uniref:Proteasome activator complex subunit 1 n=1 Tax=Hucho hucho TaxID=62062 RepID=A0A4W5NG86_9TELE
MTSIDIRPESKKMVGCQFKLCNNKHKPNAETLVTSFFPQKIAEMEILLKKSFSTDGLAALKSPLDIPMPDPAKEEAKRKKKEERVESLLKEIKPQIQILKEKLNTVSMWVQLQIPQIEDGNNFGVAVQEKVFELLTNTRTKIEGFQTQISKYYSERGDAVDKASKEPHVGDYRQLVHELDQYQYCELRIMVLEIRNTYAVLLDIINKNYDKIKKPRGDCKALIY